MKKIVQQPPFTILIEPTEGCNLGCWFCGLHGMREKGTKPWYFMDVETAYRIASEIKRVGWKSKIVFAQHGEPTLNPDFLEIVKVFRNYLPENIFHIYTNGYAINRAEDKDLYVEQMFDAGINNIIVDCYSENGDWNFINELKQNWNIVYYSNKVPLYSKSKKPRILLLPPIQDNEKVTRKLANHCGAAAPLDCSYNNKRCAMPFRELAFRWDGNVTLCCDDFRGEYPIANIFDMKIDDIWNHERFQAARIMLYNYNRNFRPCDGCTNISFRVGFLPDYKGAETLPPITEEVQTLAQSVHRFGPLSNIVKRKWEN